MNYLWAGMILIGVIYAAFTGNMSAVTNAALDKYARIPEYKVCAIRIEKA